VESASREPSRPAVSPHARDAGRGIGAHVRAGHLDGRHRADPLTGGVDDFLNPQTTDFFLGAGVRFNDEDLKALHDSGELARMLG
jgi:hypothetical protein